MQEYECMCTVGPIGHAHGRVLLLPCRGHEVASGDLGISGCSYHSELPHWHWGNL